MGDPLLCSSSQRKMDSGRRRAGKKSSGLKKPHGCSTLPAGGDAAMLRNDAILGEKLRNAAPEGQVTNPCQRTVLHSRSRTPSPSLSQPTCIGSTAKKTLNKENKPCPTNPRAVSSAHVSNGFSTPLPSAQFFFHNTPSITAVSGLGWRGWGSPPRWVWWLEKPVSVYLRQLFCQSKRAGVGLL